MHKIENIHALKFTTHMIATEQIAKEQMKGMGGEGVAGL